MQNLDHSSAGTPAGLLALHAQTLALAIADRAGLPEAWRAPGAVTVLEETGSTNTDLMEFGRVTGAAHAPHRCVLAARMQTAGRGRRGNQWLSAPDAALMLSLGLRIACAPAQLLGLPLLCGLAIRDALAAQGVAVQLKWPNDVLDAHGAKLGGLLMELHVLQSMPQAECWVVVGLGLNRALDAHTRTALADRAVTDLVSLGAVAHDPHALVADWIAALERRLAHYLAPADATAGVHAIQGFGPFVAEFNAVHAYHGKPVRLTEREVIIAQGEFAGIGAGGEARVRYPDGRVEAHLSGDLSLRGAA
jgi:BirA family biotin operon repressor/biotin-[acetyl-CoA-carboxylase] ligase